MMVFTTVEEGDLSIAEGALDEAAIRRMAIQYGPYLSLRLEGLGATRHYSVRSRGYVGLFPLGRAAALHVAPKVASASVWAMLQYAYGVGRMRWLAGSGSMASLEGIASVLVQEFIELLQARLRRGLAWEFAEREAAGTPLRGKILGPAPHSGWSLRHRFAEGGTDHALNQLPLWALYHLCSMPWEQVLQRRLRRLYRNLSAQVGLVPVERGAVGRFSYARSRADYAPLHELSRFFLKCSGPDIGRGKGRITPFILHMPSLYEACVAQWIAGHYGGRYTVKRQWQVGVPGSHSLSFRMDIALLEAETDRPLAVFDTKYKLDVLPSPADVQQMAAYAVHLGVRCGFLLYPHAGMEPGVWHVGDVEVHALGLDFASGESGSIGCGALDYINYHINKNM